jgi:hypothetical protein
MADEPAPDFLSFLPPNILEEIGKIAVAFTFMEDELDGFIADMLGAGMDVGQAVTFTVRSISERIKLTRTLVKLKVKFNDHRDTALALLTDADAANTKRNTLIHHAIIRLSFNVDPDAHEIEYLRKDHRFRERKGTRLKAAELKALTKELRRIARGISQVAQCHRVASGNPARRS